uniref:U-box domain-containing protein n=1 Tax=Aureoumbra lagunensis TaxID=44058 RepID=A0A7S3NKQ3_9STRA
MIENNDESDLLQSFESSWETTERKKKSSCWWSWDLETSVFSVLSCSYENPDITSAAFTKNEENFNIEIERAALNIATAWRKYLQLQNTKKSAVYLVRESQCHASRKRDLQKRIACEQLRSGANAQYNFGKRMIGKGYRVWRITETRQTTKLIMSTLRLDWPIRQIQFIEKKRTVSLAVDDFISINQHCPEKSLLKHQKKQIIDRLDDITLCFHFRRGVAAPLIVQLMFDRKCISCAEFYTQIRKLLRELEGENAFTFDSRTRKFCRVSAFGIVEDSQKQERKGPKDYILPTLRSSVSTKNDNQIPSSFLCPITLSLLRDPVVLVTGSGHSFERAALEAHLRFFPYRDPITNIDHPSKLKFTPNRALKAAIDEWLTRDESDGAEVH